MSFENVRLDHRNVRSVNLAHEIDSESPLQGFIVGERELDSVRRFEELCEKGPRSRAWSVIGPYGAGKSTFAHFLLSLSGPSGDPAQAVAARKLSDADEALAVRFSQIRSDLKVEQRGFIKAAATADREPISRAIGRALYRGLLAYVDGKRGRKPAVLGELEEIVRDRSKVPDSGRLLSAIDGATRIAPVVIVVDELGKALEYAATNSQEGDLYLLQQIAERFSSSDTFDGALVGLQHLAFEDYAVGLSASKRREWRKIQGRFDDVPFVGATGHSARLLGESIVVDDPEGSATETWQVSVEELVQIAPELKSVLTSVGPGSGAFPLHPSVVPALIDLAGRYGQHDRSLVSFLASDEVGSLPRWLEEHSVSETADSFRLFDLYDYFVEGSAGLGVSGEDAARLREVRNRLLEALNLEPLQVDVLKSIGILNLVGRGEYRASFDLLFQAVAGPSGEVASPSEVESAIDAMMAQGLVVYREFADEFRVWQGSDFDVQGAIASAKAQYTQEAALSGPLVERIQATAPRRALVASRHSQATGVLRYFDVVYVNAAEVDSVELDATDADGVLLLVLAPEGLISELPQETSSGRPIAALVSSDVRGLADAAIDAASALEVLSEASELEQDVVARQEVRHRAVLSQAALRERIDSAFAPESPSVTFIARGAEVEVLGSRDVSATLSLLCDEAYPKSPELFNEMLNRRELTSQGAKTRRELIELMCLRESEPELGIEGSGPVRSLYDSVLLSTGLHRETDKGWTLSKPKKGSGIETIWVAIESFFKSASDGTSLDVLYEKLKMPPVGAKEGPIPLMLAAALLVHRDDVFVFEEQTFLPSLGPEHFERLVKAPERFSVKKASMVGVRGEAFRQMQNLVGVEETQSSSARNATMLSVIRPLIGTLHSLNDYARQTKRISDTAIAVRNALQTTREPDELIFGSLPEACGFGGDFSVRGKVDSDVASEFVSTLKSALDELQGAYEDLVLAIENGLKTAFESPGPVSGLREDLRVRSRHLEGRVIDRRLRSFLLMAMNEDLDEREWYEAIATVLAQKPPSSWADADIAVFESAALEVAGPFLRLELLYREMGAKPAQGFRSSRVTVTQPEGQEDARVLAIETGRESEMSASLDGFISDMDRKFGTGAKDALLVLLAEKVLSAASPTMDDSAKPKKSSSAGR